MQDKCILDILSSADQAGGLVFKAYLDSEEPTFLRTHIRKHTVNPIKNRIKAK